MEQYLGVKLIEAEFMKQGDFREGQGSVKFIKREDYETLGYKVKYEDGYESWSPKEVFEKAYRRIELQVHSDLGEKLQPHQERVIKESMELSVKVEDLGIFINDNPFFGKLDEKEQERLTQQLLAMKYYLTILVERIENF